MQILLEHNKTTHHNVQFLASLVACSCLHVNSSENHPWNKRNCPSKSYIFCSYVRHRVWSELHVWMTAHIPVGLAVPLDRPVVPERLLLVRQRRVEPQQRVRLRRPRRRRRLRPPPRRRRPEGCRRRCILGRLKHWIQFIYHSNEVASTRQIESEGNQRAGFTQPMAENHAIGREFCKFKTGSKKVKQAESANEWRRAQKFWLSSADVQCPLSNSCRATPICTTRSLICWQSWFGLTWADRRTP